MSAVALAFFMTASNASSTRPDSIIIESLARSRFAIAVHKRAIARRSFRIPSPPQSALVSWYSLVDMSFETLRVKLLLPSDKDASA